MELKLIEVTFGTPAYDECIQLRERILRIPLGLTFDTEELESEYRDIHLAAYDEQWNLVGCLVMTPNEDQVVQMRQVAVEEIHQSQGIGRELVRLSEEIAAQRDFNLIYLHARDSVIPFYKKLKYERVGNTFTEVGILHQRMEKKLG